MKEAPLTRPNYCCYADERWLRKKEGEEEGGNPRRICIPPKSVERGLVISRVVGKIEY